MAKLVLIRHGQSEWNLENRFTGWTDVDITSQGREEAIRAGRLLRKGGFEFDTAYTSVLKRAIRTLWIVLDELDMMYLPVTHSWRLNERHYGALQGQNKKQTAKEFGEEQVHIWRRSYDVQPPALAVTDPRFPGHDRRYANLTDAELPRTESLKDTVTRFMPLWHDHIAPDIKAGKHIIIAAHGNSLRALVKYLDNMSDTAIVSLEIPTGVPLVYELDSSLKPLNHYYLGQ